MRVISTSSDEQFVGLRHIHRLNADPSAPLIILVHGRAGTAEVMWAFDRVLPPEASVVSIQAFLPDAVGGYSWWDISTTEPKEPRILGAADRLEFAVERFIALHELSPRVTVALGFSQGSVVLSAGFLRGTLQLDALGVLAGSVFRGKTQPSAKPSGRVFIGHGTEDEIVTIDKAREGVAFIERLGIPVTYVEEPAGHKIGIQGMKALKGFLAEVVETAV